MRRSCFCHQSWNNIHKKDVLPCMCVCMWIDRANERERETERGRETRERQRGGGSQSVGEKTTGRSTDRITGRGSRGEGRMWLIGENGWEWPTSEVVQEDTSWGGPWVVAALGGALFAVLVFFNFSGVRLRSTKPSWLAGCLRDSTR